MAKVARHMGVSHNQVKRWRDGVNQPSPYRLPRLRQMISEKVTVVTVKDANGCDVTHEEKEKE